MRFKNKVAVVTGSGQGIGETYAKRLAAEGASLIVAEINAEQGERVAAEIRATGGVASFVRVDVADMDSCLAMAAEAERQFGGVDCLVNNAAIFAGMVYKPLLEVELDYYHRVMAVNFHGSFHVTRAVAPLMIARGGGAIVNQSSTAAYAMTANGPYYGISKLATNGLTMAFASELGSRNIRVNGIAPGPTMTEALKSVDEAIIARIVGQMPLGRLGTTDEMADAVLYLLSDDASFITGQTLCVDGGMVRKP